MDKYKKGGEFMLTIKKILVPTDLSAVSVPAIGYAGSLAKDHDAEVILLHVVPLEAMKKHFTGGYADSLALPPGAGVNIQREADIDSFYEQKKQRLIAFVQQRIGSDLRKSVKIRPIVKPGKVVEEIIATAREERCDLIVINSEGRRLSRLFGGSVTERLVRQAPCPVLSMQPTAQISIEKDQRLEVKLIDQWAA
jgi:nucleotide-binding universal stress UspA family protein